MSYDLGFNTLYGASTGNVQGSQDVMKQFSDLLKASGREEFEGYNWMGSGSLGGLGKSRGYNLQDWQNYLDPSSSTYGGWEEGDINKERASLLFDMFQGSGIMDLSQGYGQDVGDISSEFGAQLQGLQKGYGAKTKGGRYGKVGTGGRNVGGGGRSKYMSDIYGLQQRQTEMQQGLKDQFSEDFYSNLATWQGINPAPYIGDDN